MYVRYSPWGPEGRAGPRAHCLRSHPHSQSAGIWPYSLTHTCSPPGGGQSATLTFSAPSPHPYVLGPRLLTASSTPHPLPTIPSVCSSLLLSRVITGCRRS